MDNNVLRAEIKRRVEKLLIWFIPVFLLTVFATFFSGKTAELIVDNALVGSSGMHSQYKNIIIVLEILKGMDNIVVSLWLFFQSKHFKFNCVLWSAFGFIEPFFAVIMFLLVLLIEEKKNILSDKVGLP